MTKQDEIVSLSERVRLYDRDIMQKENSLKELRIERRKAIAKIYRLEKTLEKEGQP